jgi:hypothetical protein
MEWPPLHSRQTATDKMGFARAGAVDARIAFRFSKPSRVAGAITKYHYDIRSEPAYDAKSSAATFTQYPPALLASSITIERAPVRRIVRDGLEENIHARLAE